MAVGEDDKSNGCPARVTIPLPAVEIALPHRLPLPGSSPGELKVIDQESSGDRFMVTLEAPGDRDCTLRVRLNRPGIKVSGGGLAADRLNVHFPPGPGFQRLQITFEW